MVARIAGRERGSIVLCGHLDTVSVAEDSWERSPLEPAVEDDRLWGLGAADMKSAVAVLLQTLARLAKEEQSPEKDIVLVLTADEEWGYRGAASIAKSGLIGDAELLLIAEPTSNGVYVGQKGELWIEATFSGHEAHGSVPETGASAILPAARFCSRLQEQVARWFEVPGEGRTTLNIGRFDGGRQVNIVADHATIQLDLRVISDNHYEAVIQAVSDVGNAEASMAGCTFSYKEMSYHPPIHTKEQHPWGGKLIAASSAVTGIPQPLGRSPFSTDAVSIVPVLDIPVFVCGPGSIAQAHRPDEYIELDQIAQSLELYKTFVA
ncbi:M20 family metallopeptidase [Candidatus Bipolaricaulota bacterium]